MRKSWMLSLLVAPLFLSPKFNCAQDSFYHPQKEEIIRIMRRGDNTSAQLVISDPELYGLRWDTLSQPRFWRQIMRLPAEVSLISVAENRKILGAVSTDTWRNMPAITKEHFKDSLRLAHGLDTATSLLVTFGKNHFYRFREVLPSISRGIEIFREENTDPWYAQTILLIESPAQLKKSSVGAYGPFQLMRSVAISQGLKVNKMVDEREDFDKSARAAAGLIRKICLPYARNILESHGITYREDELWFRLFVMHCYHAGAGNVRRVVDVIAPTEGGMKLIQQMWRTEAGGFRNSSQNYTQLSLAALLELEEILLNEWEYVCQ